MSRSYDAIESADPIVRVGASIAHGAVATIVTGAVAREWFVHLVSSVLVACTSAIVVHFLRRWLEERRRS